MPIHGLDQAMNVRSSLQPVEDLAHQRPWDADIP
jgi:hypothetical protein